jgi:alpha-beta hydrolase superfamily lysophospholipase
MPPSRDATRYRRHVTDCRHCPERGLDARADSRSASYRAITATANLINFAAHIRAPKLILQGGYDEDTPLRTTTEPLFKLLSEPKRLTLYDGGHVPSIEVLMTNTSGWLEEQLGRVVH